ASTVPANGDVNPYGVAIVPRSVGRLHEGHILVSNFNNQANMQGTGTTIVQVGRDGNVQLFAAIDPTKLPGPCPGGVGLTTALVVLRAGWVIVGSLPTTDGTAATAKAGCLIVLDANGTPVETFAGVPINGPWDMTAADGGFFAVLFFTNVLNGTVAANGQVVNQGTVVRASLILPPGRPPVAQSMTVIASGLPERTDPAALVIGPTGVALGFGPGCEADASRDCHGGAPVLYLADTLSNRIATISDPFARQSSAGLGGTLSANGTLKGPLGIAVTDDQHVLAVNADNGVITEVAADGTQLAHERLDNTGSPPRGAGTLFGLQIKGERHVFFVDDGSNTLNLLH
ncbi:MAG: hypothetical protein JO047_01265, partial [Alphaproteobacteria bacterium]|nr:hypothetical protein [Alphaproteobacteria bacterium]